MIKNYLKSYIWLIGIIIGLTIILAVTNYFIRLPVLTFKMIILLVASFISSIILGKMSKEKAYLEGLKYSVIYLVIVTIIRLIMHINFNYKVVIMYIAIVFTSIVGAMIGINIKKQATS